MKKQEFSISLSSANVRKSRDKATLVTRIAKSLQETRIEDGEGPKMLAHHAIASSGREAIHCASASRRFKESSRT